MTRTQSRVKQAQLPTEISPPSQVSSFPLIPSPWIANNLLDESEAHKEEKEEPQENRKKLKVDQPDPKDQLGPF